MHDPEAEAVSPAGLQVDGAAAQCLEAASSNRLFDLVASRQGVSVHAAVDMQQYKRSPVVAHVL